MSASSGRIPLGGPVRRDRTFVFGTYERVQQERGSYIQSPAPGMYTGRLDEWYALARLTQRWNETHTSSLRLNGNFSGNDNVNDRIGGFTQASAAQMSKQQAAGAQFTDHAAGTRWVNEARYAYSNCAFHARRPRPQISIVRPNYNTDGGSTNSWCASAEPRRGERVDLDARFALRKGGAGTLARSRATSPCHTLRRVSLRGRARPVAGQNPQTYTQTFGTGDIRYGQSIATGFVQDDYHPIPRLL